MVEFKEGLDCWVSKSHDRLLVIASEAKQSHIEYCSLHNPSHTKDRIHGLRGSGGLDKSMQGNYTAILRCYIIMSPSSSEKAPRRRRGKANQQVAAALSVLPKSNTMYFIILGVWLASAIGLVIFAYALYPIPTSVLARILLVFAALSLLVFWFYALYHWGLVFFRHMGKIRKAEPGEQAPPQIALLYTTVDDFRHDAALSCVEQDYPSFHVFLIDVSQSQAGRNQVDEFHRSFPEKTTIVRRETLEGFKARSINLALSNQAQGYELFGLCDSDGLLPRDFLKRAAAYFH